MKRTFHLASVLRKSGSGSSDPAKKSGNMMVFYGIIAVIAAGFLGWVGLHCQSSPYNLFCADPVSLCAALNLAGAIFGIVILIPQMLNHMYMADDLPVLLTMPYTVTQIITARIINLSGLLILISAVASLPFAITSGITLGMGAGYYIAAILGFICVPVIVISIVGIVLMVIMYFVKGIRNNDTLKVIGAILVMVLFAVWYLCIGNGNSADLMHKALHAVTGAANILPINFALKGLMMGGGLISILEVLGITAAFAGVFGLLVSKIYLPSALSMQETAGHNGALAGKEFAKKCRRQSVLRAYVQKDFRMVKRNPAYLLRGFLYPVCLTAVMMFSIMFFSEMGQVIGVQALAARGSAVYALCWTIGYALLITTMASCMSVIPASCMSREGDMIQILKQTPVDHKLILKSKLITGMIPNMLGSTTYILIGGLVLVCMGYLPIWCLIVALIVNVGILFFVTSISMLHDVKHPRFVWDSEVDMLKKCGSNWILIVLFVVAFIGSIAFVILADSALLPAWGSLLIAAAVVLLSIVGGVLGYTFLMKTGCDRMKKY